MLAVQKTNGELAVTLGPVELTEVIRDCDIALDQPVDFSQAIEYSAPDFPGAHSPVPPIDVQPAVWTGRQPTLLRRIANNGVTIHRFRVVQIASTSGIGIRISSDAGGVKFIGQTMMHLSQPYVALRIRIASGSIHEVTLALHGAAGITVQFESGSDVGIKGNVNERVDLPVDFSIPIVGPPVPFAITIRHAFILKTAFTAQGVLQAKGDYTFGGAFKVGYQNSRFGVTGPTDFSAKESFVKSVDGVSMGVSALVLTHQAKVIAGIGAFGFVTGPYFGLNSSVAVYRHTDLDVLARCKGASLTAEMVTGLGYAMPRVITNAINVFLRALNIDEIRGEGGVAGPRLTLANQHGVSPQSPACM